MNQRVEGSDTVQAPRSKLDLGHVALNELRGGYCGLRENDVRPRDVDTYHMKAGRQRSGRGPAGSATEIQHARTWIEFSHQ
jgi:hypothetical protein